MPPRTRNKTAAKATQRVATRPRRSDRGAVSTPAKSTDEDEESDDPLALPPEPVPRTQQIPRTQRKSREDGRTNYISKSSRLQRSVDRVVGGVEMAEGDLIPPSDEDEFDAWAAMRTAERRMRERGSSVSTRSVGSQGDLGTEPPSSPTEMIRKKIPASRNTSNSLSARLEVPANPTAVNTGHTIGAAFSLFPDDDLVVSADEGSLEWSASPSPESILATERSQTPEMVISGRGSSGTSRRDELRARGKPSSDRHISAGSGKQDATRSPAPTVSLGLHNTSRSPSPDLTPPPSPSLHEARVPPRDRIEDGSMFESHIGDNLSTPEDEVYEGEVGTEDIMLADPAHTPATNQPDPSIGVPERQSSQPVVGDINPHLITPEPPSSSKYNVVTPPRTNNHTTPQSARFSGIERVPLYSLTTPKRRCMQADFVSPSRPFSISQPISPQPPLPSFGESQYNQLAATMRRRSSSQLVPEEFHTSTPRSIRAVSINTLPNSPPRFSQPASLRPIQLDDPHPHQTDLPASSHISSPHKPPEPPPPPVAPIDAALHQFRSARTFRTRTALQLQPYTRERAVYEAVLRRGGLKNGKHAIALPKDISSDEDEEEEGPESSQSATPLPETIVIGGTPIPPPKHREYRRVEVTEFDRSEYFVRHGLPPGSAEEVDASLQRIARKRIRAEKKERRRQKAERMREKEFESLLRGRTIFQDKPEREQASDRRDHAANGVKKTYTRKSATSRAEQQQGDKSQPLLTPASSPLHYDISDMPAPSPPLGHPFPPEISPSRSSPRPMSLSPLADANIGRTFTPFSPEINLGEYDTNTPDMLDAQADEDSGGSESDSDASTPNAPDRRAKIARRMLPAAMLKRLEAEAASKERRKRDQHSAKDPQTEAVVAPGKAVRRRGNGEIDLNIFDDEESSDESLAAASGAAQSIPNIYEVADSSDMDSDSQAEEDNRGGETLARLYDGDFESIVRGGPARRIASDYPRHRKRHSRPKRPVVHLTRRRTGRARGMVQTRLDFPYDNASTTRPAGRVSGSKSLPARPRPAIRLDERTIFSAHDFDLEDKHDTPVRTKKPPSRSAAVSTKEATFQGRLDAEVGKAKSWANLEKFSVDFDISPLPSGLECSGFPIPRLADLVDMLDSPNTGGRSIDSVEHLGIDFDIAFDDPVMQDTVVRYFEVLQDRLLTSNDSSSIDASDVVTFISCAMLNPTTSTQDEPGFVAILDARLTVLQEKLDAIMNTIGIGDRDRCTRFLGTLWFILELRVVMTRKWNSASRTSAVDSVAIALFSVLLSVGFDKAIRPLKMCLRGESVNGKMTDTLTCMWIAATHAIEAYDRHSASTSDTLNRVILQAVAEAFHFDLVGPIAAERIWYITFGLCAISQFNDRGRTTGGYEPVPRWDFVRKVLSLIKIAHEEEADEKVHVDLLRGRDRYVRVMMARCVRLSAVWKWGFTRETFPIITKDLGTTFKQRQYRNFPTEPPVDYPDWITSFEIAATAVPETKHETAFEMYLRLVCVAASDMIGTAQSLTQAQQAEKDIQRLTMSIIPVSPVKFSRDFPPTPRQLAQLINRYATMVAACYFSPSILPWLLANSRKWTNFETADFDSRQISIRGLMYVAVACRHHGHSLRPIIARLSEILQTLQGELDTISGPSIPFVRGRDAVETRRTMVLVISCFKQIIIRHTFDSEVQALSLYPDPSLLDTSWTSRIFDLSLHDFRSGLEVVGAIQAYLDTRLQALPPSVKKAREERVESQDEFGSLGFELDPVTVAQLGGYEKTVDEAEVKEAELATIIAEAIAPRIYRLLSDILSANTAESDAAIRSDPHRTELLQRLTTCWADCAVILVVDHRRLDWSTFIGPFGQQSWLRFSDDTGRIQVGLPFMLNILELDSSAFRKHSDEFISLFFSVIATDRITVEHKLVSLLLRDPAFVDHALFKGVERVWQSDSSVEGMTQETYFEIRPILLETVFVNIAQAFNISTGSLRKPFLYRCINDLVSSLDRYLKSIPEDKVIHKQSYRVYTDNLVRSLRDKLGDHISPLIVPALRSFPPM